MNISVTQAKYPELVLPHLVSNPVIKPVVEGGFLEELPLSATIQELTLKVTKDGNTFWVGAAVPFGTTDFTKIQVFFHPTVVQVPNVIAREEDYPEFVGGWETALRRYVPIEGGQLAAVRRMPLIVPFTTMAAINSSANMFKTDPVATLSYIVAAAQALCDPLGIATPPELAAVGVASFSSGISAMRLFINALAPSGLIKEIIDFDSPWIIGNPAVLTVSPGAVSSCYSQQPSTSPGPPPGYRFLPASSFAHISSNGGDVHACIGRMMYYTAMITSVVV